MDSEETLTERWLNLRQTADERARSLSLLDTLLGEDGALPELIDLGAGSGNNTLYCLKHLRTPARFVLVEQHEHLLFCARQRIRQFLSLAPPTMALGSQIGDLIETPETLTLRGSAGEICIQFICANVFDWLANSSQPAFYTSSALLDLLTKSELQLLLKSVHRLNSPLLCALNYTGFMYSPVDPGDGLCRSLFEQHMTRKIDRGRPLGAGVVAFFRSDVVQSMNYQCRMARSDWVINSQEAAFLHMNLEFHQKGALSECNANEVDTVNQWVSNRRRQIEQGSLELTVTHQDILLLPNAHSEPVS